MTREDIIRKLIDLRVRKIVLTWDQFASAIASSSLETKAIILEAVNKLDGSLLAKTVFDVAIAKKKAIAQTQVESIAADDTFTIDELITLLS